MASWVLFSGSHKAELKVSAGATFSPAAWGFAKLIQIVSRIWFLLVAGLRSCCSCWLLAAALGSLSALRGHSHILATWVPSIGSSQHDCDAV